MTLDSKEPTLEPVERKPEEEQEQEQEEKPVDISEAFATPVSDSLYPLPLSPIEHMR